MPGLPRNLLSTYQKYKNHTDSIAQWLAATAKGRGYISPKSKGSAKNGKASRGRPTYTVPTKEWVAMAEFIVGLVDPTVAVPEKLAALLDATIGLRQSYSDDISEILDETESKKESDDRHAFFLSTLRNVRNILGPRLPKRPKTQSPPRTIQDVINIFDHLELQEPSEAFEEAPDVVPAPNAPIYKAERPNDMEEAYFALCLLLHDFAKLRTEVSHAWAGYKNGGHDIVAASITTNVAVDLARSMTEELKGMFAQHGGAMKMYKLFYASQCVMAGTSVNRRQRPGDDINFATYNIADSVFWPAYTILEAWCGMHKVNPHPEMKPGFYGTYNPASNRAQKTDREKFLEDKILLLENLPEFYFYCRTTKPNPPPVEDEFIRGLRTMFETKEVTLPLVFASALFLDIHNLLRDGVDHGFERLTDATHYVVTDIQEQFKFHQDITMETWPRQNYDFMQQFVDKIEFWVHKDQNRVIAPKLGRIFTPQPFHLYRKHPWWCGLWKYWTLMQFHEISIAFVNAWGSVMSCAHLYNAIGGGGHKDMLWKDLDIVLGLQGPKTFFIGDAPKTPEECLKRFALAMGASAANLAKSTRTRRGLIHSKKGPKGLKELGAVLQTFRARICDVNGPKDIRAEDVQKILENSSWEYELDEHDNAKQIYKDLGEAPGPSIKRELSVSKCVGLIRDMLHSEMMEISFDYLRLHRQCWRLLRFVKDACRDDLIRMFGPDYIQKESELPFIVGYVLLSATSSQQVGELLKAKRPDVQVTDKVLEDAKAVVKAMIDSGAGAMIVEQILPRALNLQIDFEFETEE